MVATLALLLTALCDAAPRLPAAACSVANGTVYHGAKVLACVPPPPAGSAPPTPQRCCALCAQRAGCAFFTFYPNQSCALLSDFGQPRLSPGTVSGSKGSPPAPMDYAHHHDAALLAGLRALPRLPKPHYSWPILPTSTTPEYTRDPYVHEVSRIIGSVSFSAEFADRERTADVVRACIAANASVGIHFWGMWRRLFPPKAPPTYEGPEVAAELARYEKLMRAVAGWLADANTALSSDVRVGLIMLDVERFRTQGNGSAWDRAITAKHTRVFELTKAIFPGVSVSWFGRGGCHRGPLPQARHGWWCGDSAHNFFTLKEPADAFSVTQYTLWEPGYRREAFRRTVAHVSGAVARGAAPGRPLIHTYISLGAGLRRSIPAFKAGVSTGREYVDSYEYDTTYDWMAGGEINEAGGYSKPPLASAMAPYNYSNLVVIYPSVFVHPGQLDHFLAYARGAHQVFAPSDRAPAPAPRRWTLGGG